jgi:CTP synthase (UTP-ammonia lyase)
VGATSEEYGVTESPLIVTRLVCSLAGKKLQIRVTPNTLAHRLYRSDLVDEQYYCNFGFNEAYRAELEAHGLRFTGRSDDGEARILEIPDHPFFLATLFVPQTASLPGKPHPLIAGFASAAEEFRAQRASTAVASA